MFKALIETRNDRVMTLIRLALGLVIFPHGAQKMLGWFGGPGFRGSMEMFTGMGLPATLGFLAILAEFLGSIALITGLFGRLGALAVAVNMFSAVLLVHVKNGFFMNWSGIQGGEGYEFHILALGLALAVLVRGSGAASLDLKLYYAGESRNLLDNVQAIPKNFAAFRF